MRRLVLTLLVLIPLGAARAEAGTYDVSTCGTTNVNRTWTFATSDAATVGGADACATGQGLQVYELIGTGPAANLGDAAWWTFTAPSGTVIAGLDLARFLHTFSDPGWHAEIRVDGSALEECHRYTADPDCYRGSESGDRFAASELAGASVGIGGYCVPDTGFSVCERGGPCTGWRRSSTGRR